MRNLVLVIANALNRALPYLPSDIREGVDALRAREATYKAHVMLSNESADAVPDTMRHLASELRPLVESSGYSPTDIVELKEIADRSSRRRAGS